MPTDLSMLGKWMFRGGSKDSAAMSRCLKRRMIEEADDQPGDKTFEYNAKWPSRPSSATRSLMLSSRFSDTPSDGKSDEMDMSTRSPDWFSSSAAMASLSSGSDSESSGSALLRSQNSLQAPFGGLRGLTRDEPDSNCCPEFREHSFWG